MKVVDIIRRAGKNLKQSKGRTILTALAISVGAFTLTLSLAIGAGTRSYFATVMETNINSQSLMIAKDESLTSMTGGGFSGGLKEYDETAQSYGGGFSYKTLGPDDFKKVADDKDITEVMPSYDVQAEYFVYENQDKKYTSAVYTYDKTIRNEAAAGNLPKLGEMIKDDEIVIPEDYLNTLNIKKASDAIGKNIMLHVERRSQVKTEEEMQKIFQERGLEGITEASKTESKDVTFKIVAVAAKPATAMAASNQLAISDTRAKELSEYITQGTSGFQHYTTGMAIVKDGVSPETVRDRLKKQGIVSMTAKDLQSMLFMLVNVMQMVIAGFGILALIASIFGIINTQYISVLERTSQIGLMKALGMSNRGIGRLFRYEAAWIGFLGAMIGVVLAIVTGLIINPWITDKLKLGDGNTLLIFQPIPIILLIAFLVLVAIVAGFFPSRKAAKLDPIEALRTE